MLVLSRRAMLLLSRRAMLVLLRRAMLVLLRRARACEVLSRLQAMASISASEEDPSLAAWTRSEKGSVARAPRRGIPGKKVRVQGGGGRRRRRRRRRGGGGGGGGGDGGDGLRESERLIDGEGRNESDTTERSIVVPARGVVRSGQ
eukprot:408416-Pleurochrysis_carterae.AAC.1